MVHVMETDKHSVDTRATKHIRSFFGISIIVVFAILIGMYMLSSSNKLVQEMVHIQATQNEASVNYAQKGAEKEATNTNQTNSIWDTLRTKSLQEDHYTLKIKGRQKDSASLNCTVSPNPETGTYGDTVYLQNNSALSQNNKIIRLDSSMSDKYARSEDKAFGVHDACTAPLDGDVAEISLPKAEKGYYVVSRILGKPTHNSGFTIDGNLFFIKDEFGSDYLVLGLITGSGFQTPVQTSTQGDTVSVPKDISGLFEWSGKVCYFDSATYCAREPDAGVCTSEERCCTDTDEDEILDSCIDATRNFDETLSCTTGALTALSCRTYVNESIFNIAEFVTYLWNVDDEGNFKEADFLFYPVR